MKIANPFWLLLKAMYWPFGKIANLLICSIAVQKWTLTKFAAMGAPQESLNAIARSFNDLNHRRGVPVIFAIPETETVERTPSDEATPPTEAKP